MRNSSRIARKMLMQESEDPSRLLYTHIALVMVESTPKGHEERRLLVDDWPGILDGWCDRSAFRREGRSDGMFSRERFGAVRPGSDLGDHGVRTQPHDRVVRLLNEERRICREPTLRAHTNRGVDRRCHGPTVSTATEAIASRPGRGLQGATRRRRNRRADRRSPHMTEERPPSRSRSALPPVGIGGSMARPSTRGEPSPAPRAPIWKRVARSE